MRYIVTKAAVASIICTLLSLDGGSMIERAEAAELLSGAMLRQNIPGARIQLDTPVGSVIPIAYGEDGSLQGRAGAVAFFLGAQRDRGKWWVEGSKLCHRWNTWFNGRVNCVRVYREADNRIEWVDQDGERGTGAIVELRNVVDSAPKPSLIAAPTHKVASQAAASEPVKRAPKREPETSNAVIERARIAPSIPAPPAPEKKPEAQKAPSPRPTKSASVVRMAVPPPPKKAAKSVDPAVTFRVVNVAFDDVLNVRSGPSPIAKVVSTIPPRATGLMKVAPCEGEWCPVQHGQSTGWVHLYFIAPEDGARGGTVARTLRNPIMYRVVRVAPYDVLNLRRRPASESAIVGTIPSNGKRIRLTGYCVGEWCPVKHNLSNGWAHRYFLALEF
jgi:SH3-like domain-containing protein